MRVTSCAGSTGSSTLSAEGELDLTLVVPCWNEAPHLAESVRRIVETLARLRYEYEIVFVDDASTDDTPAILRGLAGPRVRVVTHPVNRGRGAAVSTGFRAARGRIVGFIDIDLEIGPHYIAPLVAAIEGGADVAIGARSSSLHSLRQAPRFAISRAYAVLQQAALGLDLSDTETGCKFFRKETCTHLVEQTQDERWFFDTEIVARAVLAHLVVREVPVIFERSTKPSTVRVWRDSWRQLRALSRFRREVGLSNVTKAPIYWSDELYDQGMELLFGPYREEVLGAVAALVPDGSSVVDVCCGTARLGRDFLVPRGCSYVGLDFNARFVMAARKAGIDTRQFEMFRDEIPVADHVVICSSLYHFVARQDEVIETLRASARDTLIVSEPVARLMGSALDGMRGTLTAPGVGDASYRYTPDDFRALCERHGASELREEGRSFIAVFDGTAPQR
jgi:glycosyltransferase involved in cell wall biosynthesis